MANRNLKARYRTVGPKREIVKYTKCFIDENGALQQEQAKKRWNAIMCSSRMVTAFA
jgi:hypothetical protein